MNQLALSENNRSSVLSIQSRQLLDNELDKPAGLPLIQALLLLGDFECAVGRDSVGWLYAGELILSPTTSRRILMPRQEWRIDFASKLGKKVPPKTWVSDQLTLLDFILKPERENCRSSRCRSDI